MGKESDSRTRVILAIAEALFPPLPQAAEEARKNGAIQETIRFLEFSGNQYRTLPKEVMDVMERCLVPPHFQEICLVLEVLNWRLGTLVLGGSPALTTSFPFLEAFPNLSVRAREKILRAWAVSRLEILRKAFKALRGFIHCNLMTRMEEEGNPLWQAMGYPGPLGEKERPAVCESRRKSEKTLLAALLDLVAANPRSSAALRKILTEFKLRPKEELVTPAEVDAEIQCDAVVVGSGGGGGVVAALLAEAGMKVLVLEKGTYTKTEDLSLSESDAMLNMYDRGGFLTSMSGGVQIFAGATVGGGTRINWLASFPTPDTVRREWATTHGMPQFTGERFQRALDAVAKRINANTDIKQHNGNNSALKAGLEGLGVHCGIIPRNCEGEHACGYCGYGCPSGEKQDTATTYLVDAVKNGAKVIAGATVERVVTRPLMYPDGPRTREAVGVVATVTPGDGGPSLRLSIRAPVVVAAGGAVQTPALLLRSGITVNGNVGDNLRLHPVTCAMGVFPEEGPAPIRGPINMWDGAMMSVYSSHAGDWDGDGYGSLIETAGCHATLSYNIPWLGGEDYKRKLLDFKNMAAFLAFTRDRDCGRVSIDSRGEALVHYRLSKRDGKTMLQGMELALRAMVAAGASRVFTLQHGDAGEFFAVQRDAAGKIVNTAEFEKYIKAVKRAGTPEVGITIYSAHQMGTARMGTSEFTSAIDPDGQCWHVSNLYVADGAALPTNTGVNPMVTIQAIAYMVAEGIAARFKEM